jgi:hypothetical protein
MSNAQSVSLPSITPGTPDAHKNPEPSPPGSPGGNPRIDYVEARRLGFFEYMTASDVILLNMLPAFRRYRQHLQNHRLA